MLKEILSVTGKPGLYKLISKANNMLIVESLTDKKRIPVYSKDKVVSLGDIAIYTETTEVPLSKVFESILTKLDAAVCSIDPKSDNQVLRNFMVDILPDYDKERVYPSDIRKVIVWYNILINNNITVFSEQEIKEEAISE